MLTRPIIYQSSPMLCFVRKNSGDLLDLIQPDDRAPVLESKVRTALGVAAAGLHDQDKADQMLRDAIRLDPAAARPKIQLARLLAGKNPEEAES